LDNLSELFSLGYLSASVPLRGEGSDGKRNVQLRTLDGVLDGVLDGFAPSTLKGQNFHPERGFSSTGSKGGLKNNSDMALLIQDGGDGDGRPSLLAVTALSVRSASPFSKDIGVGEDINPNFN
jgi:hypothetical protein